jgi:hypothetical protein
MTKTTFRNILLLSSMSAAVMTRVFLIYQAPSGLFHSRVPKTMYLFLFHPMLATFPAHFLLLDFVTRIILHEKHTLHVFSLRNSLQLPVANNPPPPRPMCPNSSNLFSSCHVIIQVPRPCKTKSEIS